MGAWESEFFLLLAELGPIILETSQTFRLLLWGLVLAFKNSYIQQIQERLLKCFYKRSTVASTGNLEDKVLGLGEPTVSLETNFITL